MVLSWELLSKGGIMGVDDYLWELNSPDPFNRPHDAIIPNLI